MTDKTRLIIAALRADCAENDCSDCPAEEWCHPGNPARVPVKSLDTEAADLIEELVEELEEKTECLAGLEIMYGKAEATNTTLYRRCDAAEDKLSELLSHVTGGRYSKPTYSIAEMKIFIEDYQKCECEVCQDVAQLVQERDAAISDLKHKYYGCDACKHYSGIKCALPVEMRKYGFTCWEWRGVHAENGGAEHE